MDDGWGGESRTMGEVERTTKLEKRIEELEDTVSTSDFFVILSGEFVELELKAAKERIKELESWAIARDNEQGRQIAKLDKCIEELESKLARYESWATAAITHFENIGDNSSVMLLSLRALRENKDE